MKTKDQARREIVHGNKYPFDETDDWWEEGGTKASAPMDEAHAAARGIIAALQDRHTIKHAFTREIDEETRKEIVDEIAQIIRVSRLDAARGKGER